ncbi:MAG TPA: hypothetical protein VN969_30640, partial [Streptosporangiaceae bacterium]|nr:hypothetical protein [Streptosporangiaceae bacterium]
GTVHGFTMSDTDAFSPSGLQHHWDRLLPLLDRTLASGQGQARRSADLPEAGRERSNHGFFA